jgi:type IV pilus assembly protein PilC
MAIKGEKAGEGLKRVSRAKKSTTTRRVTAKSTFDLDEAAAAAEVTATPSLYARLSSVRIGGVRNQDITDFLRQLIMLLEAGTPLLRSLSILSQRGERAGIRLLVTDMAEYVESGNALWQAFEKHSRYFDPVFINLIKASEASGTLTTVLKRLVVYRERQRMMYRRIMSAMWYPLILVVVCVLVLLLIAKFLLPQFQQLFDRLDVAIPRYTEFIMVWAARLTSLPVMLGAVAVVIGLIVLYQIWVNLSPLNRLYADRIKLSIPVIGKNIVRKSAIVDFTRSLSLLLRSGLSMMVTLDLVRSNIRNKAVANVMQHVRDSVERGEGIEEPLRRADRIIPPIVTDMLVTGEDAGQLDSIAEHIADTYEEEVNITLSTIGELIQPAITIFIGVVVAGLFLALFVPMIQMIQQLTAQTGG